MQDRFETTFVVEMSAADAWKVIATGERSAQRWWLSGFDATPTSSSTWNEACRVAVTCGPGRCSAATSKRRPPASRSARCGAASQSTRASHPATCCSRSRCAPIVTRRELETVMRVVPAGNEIEATWVHNREFAAATTAPL